MTREVQFSRPSITDADIEAVVTTLRSGWLTTGARTKELEEQFQKLTGAGYALAVNSATAALHLALLGWRLGPGDEVILPAMTFASCATVIMETGATPVLVDVLAGDLTVDPRSVERAITPRTRAVMAVHYAGQPARMDELRALVAGRDIKILEDAAHAPGATYKGRPVGSLGDAASFSLYATKNVTSGEGGVLVSDDGELIERARMLALHGLSRDAWKRYGASGGAWRYEVIERGYKYNLSDIPAALAVSQMRRLDDTNRERRRVAQRYAAGLRDIDGVEPLASGDDVEHAWHLFVVRLQLEHFAIGRDEFIERLREAGIAASVHFIPIHHHGAFASLGLRPGDFPVTDDAFSRIVSLPIYPDLADDEIDYVAHAISDIATKNRR